MICASCGGVVVWMGPFSNLTHTMCRDCGAINNQEVEMDIESYDELHRQMEKDE